MITTLQGIAILYNHLNLSSVKSEISGGIYKLQHPTDSKLEDVVINSITSNAEMIQTGIYNVNVHVPKSSDGLPNTARLSELAALISPLVDLQWGDKYNFWVENQGAYEDTISWYYNFRLRVKYHNTN